jgi:hypothetical protein
VEVVDRATVPDEVKKVACHRPPRSPPIAKTIQQSRRRKVHLVMAATPLPRPACTH